MRCAGEWIHVFLCRLINFFLSSSVINRWFNSTFGTLTSGQCPTILINLFGILFSIDHRHRIPFQICIEICIVRNLKNWMIKFINMISSSEMDNMAPLMALFIWWTFHANRISFFFFWSFAVLLLLRSFICCFNNWSFSFFVNRIFSNKLKRRDLNATWTRFHKTQKLCCIWHHVRFNLRCDHK